MAKKKSSFNQAVMELAKMAENLLATLPEVDQDARVAEFARRDFKRGTRSAWAKYN